MVVGKTSSRSQIGLNWIKLLMLGIIKYSNRLPKEVRNRLARFLPRMTAPWQFATWQVMSKVISPGPSSLILKYKFSKMFVSKNIPLTVLPWAGLM